MRKKGRAVPEWLNSPIWSATPPAPAPPDPYGVDLAPPPPLKPPPPAVAPPVPPPPSYEQAVGAGGGRGDEEDEGAGAVIRAQLLSDFKAALSKKVVNMGELRRLACLGVPDGGGAVRPVVWKLLLGYLPTDRSLWAYELEKKRSQYSAYKEEFLLNPVQNVKLIRDQNSGQLQGYGFVEFTSRAAAERVLQTYNGQMMPNVELTFQGQAAGPGHARRRQTGTRVRLLFPASPQGWPRWRLASRLVGNGRRLHVLL